MVGLDAVVDFIKRIHEGGFERAGLDEVAKGTGYGNATSTPFYRRLSAGRQFGLISTGGADLTPLGQDCIKPTTEGGEQRALIKALESVAPYSELITTHDGKRLNNQILRNLFGRKFELNEAAAGACANAFMDSLRFAGALAADGLLNFRAPPTANLPTNEPTGTTRLQNPAEPPHPSSEEGHRFELILDPARKRKLVIWSPSTVTATELKRIQDWLSFQLLVTEPDQSRQ